VTGKLIGIAKVAQLRAALEEVQSASVSVDAGIAGDIRGRKRNSQITILFRESWDDACKELGATLPWTTRRANLFVEGMAPPQSAGGQIRIGEVILQIALETAPCQLMERAHAGLKAALTPSWRGGVSCNVISGGNIRLGDVVLLG
jgi:MOSC domain-containing protein YiiM